MEVQAILREREAVKRGFAVAKKEGEDGDL